MPNDDQHSVRRVTLTAIRKAMDHELKVDPMAVYGGFTQNGAARVLDAMNEAVGEQSDCRELRHAAMAVVLAWDAERTQHLTMPALRKALGLPPARPTREEAEARLDAYLQTPCGLGEENCCS